MKTLAIIYILTFVLTFNMALAKTAVDESGDTSTDSEQVKVRPATPVSATRPSSDSDTTEARKYFRSSKSSSSVGNDDHYLALHLGSFISSDSYQWGQTPHVANVGRLNGGLTYRLGSYGSFSDTALRLDFIGYQLPEGNTVQVAFIPMLLFPEAGSKFPIYFGLGLGPGFFFNQIATESFLSLNYELVAGARFFNVVEGTGFFLEGGLKNNILLLSDGQFIGYFLAVGTVFTF